MRLVTFTRYVGVVPVHFTVIDFVLDENVVLLSGDVIVGATPVSIVAVLNTAFTLLLDVIDTVHVVLVPVHAPLHPRNTEPADGEAVRVAVVPLVYGEVFPAIVPAPEPDVVVVRVYEAIGMRVNDALTVLFPSITTVHVLVVDVHPVQLAN